MASFAWAMGKRSVIGWILLRTENSNISRIKEGLPIALPHTERLPEMSAKAGTDRFS